MKPPLPASLKPRKTPRQARSTVTLDAVFEATIQVLLAEGAQRLNTTRVAERAGVSVGTLYQYYPHKQALLYAVMERHVTQVVGVVETACQRLRQQPLAAMTEGLVHAFVDAKTENLEVSRALYLVYADVHGSDVLLKPVGQRLHAAMLALLATASDAQFDDLDSVTVMLRSAMVGATRAVLEPGATPRQVRVLRQQLVILCQAYLGAVARPPANVETARRPHFA